MRDKVINQTDRDTIIAYCKGCLSETRTKIDRRQRFDAALCLLYLSTGIRTEEVIRLKPGSFDFHKGQIWVDAAKGSKPRYIPFSASKELQSIFLEMFKDLRPIYSNAIEPELYKQRIRWRMKRLMTRALGRPHHYSTHSFRHTVATRALLAEEIKNNPRGIFGVKQLLGHKSLSSTYRYLTEVEANDIMEIASKANKT